MESDMMTLWVAWNPESGLPGEQLSLLSSPQALGQDLMRQQARKDGSLPSGKYQQC